MMLRLFLCKPRPDPRGNGKYYLHQLHSISGTLLPSWVWKCSSLFFVFSNLCAPVSRVRNRSSSCFVFWTEYKRKIQAYEPKSTFSADLKNQAKRLLFGVSHRRETKSLLSLGQ